MRDAIFWRYVKVYSPRSSYTRWPFLVGFLYYYLSVDGAASPVANRWSLSIQTEYVRIAQQQYNAHHVNLCRNDETNIFNIIH